MNKEYLNMSIEELEKVKEERVVKVLELREKLKQQVEEWQNMAMDIIELEDQINERQNQNDQSLSSG